MRIFVVGDIHGHLYLLDKLLGEIEPKIQEEDRLIFLGDYIDRGPDSFGVIKRLNELKLKYKSKVHFLWGNHEDMFTASMGSNSICSLDSNKAFSTWFSNGGSELINSLSDKGLSMDDFLAEFSILHNNLEPYFYIENSSVPILCVHASYPKDISIMSFNHYKFVGLWGHPSFEDKRDKNRLLICGHLPQKNVYENLPNFICVDSGSFCYKKLTCVIIDVNKISEREFITVG